MARWFSWLGNFINNRGDDDTNEESAAREASAEPADRLIVPSDFTTSAGGDKGINDIEYWWCFTGHPHEDIPLFDAVNNDVIVRDVQEKLRHGMMPLMEIPDNIMKTLRLLDDPDFSYREVANLIERSPGMAGEFLKVANSSLLGGGTTIHDLKAAMPRLGKVKIKSMLYMYSAKTAYLNKSVFNNLAVDIVEHSYAVGLIAAYLGQRYFANPDIAFFAGLLHDIGKLAILKSIIDSYELPNSDITFREEVFDRIFPGLHEKVGLAIARNWDIDELVRAAILHHHDLHISPREFKNTEMAETICALIQISDIMARMLGKGRTVGPVNVFKEEAATRLGMVKDWSTVEFLECIPEMMRFRLDRS